jgi:peptidoglycan-associated lipoprotein
MKSALRQIGLLSLVALTLSLGACSKKKAMDDGDISAGDESMNVTDLSAGQAIPELPAVYFEYDSFNLTSQSRMSLDGYVAWFKANSSRAVQVEGHTDERGTTEYNLALGERRAGAVRDYLIGKGVAAGQVSTISYGEERPAVMGSDESAWSKNRRAEFVSAGR